MQLETKTLIDTCKQKYLRAYAELSKFLVQNIKSYSMTIHNIQDFDFKVVSGVLNSFFEGHNILISTIPNRILEQKPKNKKHLWSYLMYVDKTEIFEGDFHDREMAEYVAMLKAFQFLDTKLFIEQTKNRFIDESSDVSCVKMNWEQLNKVLSYKRKNLISILD